MDTSGRQDDPDSTALPSVVYNNDAFAGMNRKKRRHAQAHERRCLRKQGKRNGR